MLWLDTYFDICGSIKRTLLLLVCVCLCMSVAVIKVDILFIYFGFKIADPKNLFNGNCGCPRRSFHPLHDFLCAFHELFPD